MLDADTFVCDVDKNTWTKAITDDRIHGHDAYSVFAYDSHADLFLLAFPPQGRVKELRWAVYSLGENKWTMIEPRGDALPQPQFGMYMGYYDPAHNVMVMQGRYQDRMWVYRHRK